ncbi:MAG: hypothetical protein M3N14_06300, partial [Bacteroidota bacterium]|nr:hypothetical protein [Bacteroidota bacterium]
MKKIFLTLIAIISALQLTYGQWSTGTDIHNTNTGNVGIGTTSPGLKLETYGAAGAPATSGITQTGILRLNQGSYYNVLDFGSYYTAPYGLWMQGTGFNNLASTYPIILQPNGGNIGIGTTSPGYKLDVQGGNASIYDSGTQSSLVIGSVATGKTYLEIKTSADASGYASLQSIGVSGTSYGNIAFNAGGGNVGIGTNGPGQKLEVDGTSIASAAAQTNISAYAANGIRLTGSVPNVSQDAIMYQG